MRKPVHGIILAVVAMVLSFLSDWVIRPTNPVLAEEWDMATGFTVLLGLLMWLLTPAKES